MDFVRLDAGSEWAAYATPSILLREGKIAEAREAVRHMPTHSALSSRSAGGVLAAAASVGARPHRARGRNQSADRSRPGTLVLPGSDSRVIVARSKRPCTCSRARWSRTIAPIRACCLIRLLAKLRTETAFDKVLTAGGACQQAVRAAPEPAGTMSECYR